MPGGRPEHDRGTLRALVAVRVVDRVGDGRDERIVTLSSGAVTGGYDTDFRVTGRPARTFAQWAHEHAADFS
ncbi:hypothetical protein [Dactylosporangium sp. NPDC005555]|uniref:hypothetical protein n=1 Tax=Dactylosporangium sp. NPDC005555 TaxID=3154889 RepID=UPI0033BB4660